MNLVPWNPRKVPTEWMPAGAPLGTVLGYALLHGAERVMLTGATLPQNWLLTAVPGWEHGSHHLDHETPVGRYVHTSGRRVEIRRAAEWFGAGDYSPSDAASAWDALARALAAAVPGAGLLGSPGATGREAWLRSVPKGEVPAQVNAEVAELLRATSGQHRIELLPAKAGDWVGGGHDGLTIAAGAHRGAPAMPGLWVLDGRLMYAACVRELGTAPVKMLTRLEASELLLDPRGRYSRARYQVRATPPPWWEGIGILPYAADDAETWEYPSKANATFTTWADSAEVFLALDYGWSIEPLAGMLFTKGRPLDTWANRLLRAYDQADVTTLADANAAQVARMVRAGLRWLLLHSVGAWHSSGRTETTVTDSPMTRPKGDGWGAPDTTKAGAVWRRRVPLDGRAALMAHPEWSAQIWGRARARVLQAPTAIKGAHAGALWVPPHQLVSIYGDAVMTTALPEWGAPQYDDGKPGRLRVKGHLCGPLDWPTTASARDRLMHQAEQNTNPCTCTPTEGNN